MKRLIFTIALVVAALTVGMRAHATPPNPVESLYTYQGAVFVDDLPFNGTGLFKLAIVNQDGQTIWSNDGSSLDGSEPTSDVAVAVDQGVFFILLGDNTVANMAEVDPAIFATDDTLFLKTWFSDGDSGFSEMTPEIELTASAFAINSQYLRGYGPDDFFLNSSQITSSQIAAGAVGTTQIAGNSITGDKITAFSNDNTDFTVGRGLDENVQIIASTGAANEPGLRYDSTTDAWQFSNDGTVWNNIGSGGGSGTVNVGAINELAYYTAAGDAVSGLATANNGVLVTSAGGVPSISSTLPGAVQGSITSVGTIGSGTWQGNAVADGFVADNLTISGGSVNNSIIGGTVPLAGTFRGLIDELDTAIQGGDLTIGLGTTPYAGRIVLHDADGADSFTTTLQSNANVPASFSLIFPADDGNASEVLTTDGSGNLSWTAVSGGDVVGPAVATDNAITRYDTATGKLIQNSGVIIDDSNNVTGIGALSITSMGQNWTSAGRTVADLGTVTTVDIDGGTIDNVSIGQGTAGLGTFTDLVVSTFLVGTSNQGDILYDNGTTFVRLTPGTSGQFLQTQGGGANPQWANATSGTVTSVDVSGGTTGLTTSGGPITGSGTITLAGMLGIASGGTGATTAAAARGNLGAAASGVNSDITSLTGLTTALTVGQGGTGATTAAAARGNLSAAASGANSDITSLSGLTTALSETQGGTGLGTYTVGEILYSDASNSLAALAIGSTGDVLTVDGSGVPSWATATSGTVTSVDVSGGTTGLTTSGGPVTGSGTITLGGTLGVASGGTGATTAAGARGNLSAAESGANSDITSLSGMTTALTIGQGGTGATTAGGARTNLGLGTIATQDANNVSISGGAVDGAAVGGTTPAAGAFTALASSGQYTNTVAGGTAPMVITSNTIVTNLNADLLDGQEGSYYNDLANAVIGSQAQGDILYFNGTSWTRLPAGTSGQVLETQGAGANPRWINAATGDVVGPAGATDNAIARYDSTTGKLIQNSLVTVNDTGSVNIPAGQTYQISGAALDQDDVGDGTTYKQYDPTSVAITGGSISGITDLAIADGGTGASTAVGARSNLGLGTIATQDANNVSISGGAVDGTAVGGTIPAAGAFTTLSSSGQYTNTVAGGTAPMVITSNTVVSNLNADLLDGQEGSYYNDLANAVIGSQAQGDVLYFDGVNWARLGAGTSGQVLQTQGAGVNPQWANASAGTVTSVDVSGGTTGLTTSGGPVTGSGTITLGGTLGVGSGGTGATTAGGARTNLGLGTIATQDAGSVAITGGSISGITDLAVADGGTGASDASTARSNLSAAASGANSDITSLSGLTTALTVGQGGTGLGTYTVGDILYSDASNSLAALAIGSSGEVLTVDGSGVPSWSAAASGTVTSVGSGDGLSGGPITGAGTLAVDGTVIRTTGAQSLADKTLTNVAITSGSISGITDLAVADGGTGASTAVGARSNLGLGTIATQDANNVSISGGAVDGAAVGGTTPAAGAFTTLSSSGQYTNTVAGGTAPMVITSNTVVSNLNADLLDGQEGSYYNDLANAVIGSQAQGDVLYFNGTSWTRLPAGTSGQVLQTQGASADPVWANAAAGTVTSVDVSGGTTGLTTSGGPVTGSGTITVGGTLVVASGGTGATTAGGARTNLGLGSIATQDASSVAITGGSISGITDLAIADGGTGASDAATARSNLSAAASGANSDITSLSGLTTALTVGQGGTGATTAAAARSNLSAAESGANSDITSLSGLTTALSETQGGTGLATYTVGDILYSDASNSLAALAIGSSGEVLTVSAGGIPEWDAAAAGTVTSVGSGDGLSGGPITGTGTLAVDSTVIRTTGAQTADSKTLTNVAITSGSISGITDLAIADGGTGASDAATARSNLGAAASGANSDITSLSGLTTALTVGQGGTGATTAAGARSNLGAAASGANSDITSLSGLTTALSETQGGTGLGTYTVGDILYSDASNSLAALAIGSSGDVLTVDGSGVPSWAATTSGTVTSVGSGDGLSGGPITGTGTLAVDSTVIRTTGAQTADSKTLTNVAITSGSISGITDLAIADGGTGASDAATARSNLGAAASGANSDITSLSGLTTALTVGQGGSGATTLTGYLIGNGTSPFTASATIPGADISGNISGNAANVTGTVAIANGGTGQTTQTAAFDALSPTTTKGDLIVDDGTNAIRLGVGADNEVLVADSAEAAGVKWTTAATGDVVGPAGATDNAITRYDGTTGKLVQDSNVTISDTGTINIPAGQVYQISGAALDQDDVGDGATYKQYDPTSVAITGGSISGITDLAIVDGGTGASTAAGARSNLGLGTIATQDASNVSISGGAVDGTAVGGSTPAAGAFTTLASSGQYTNAVTDGTTPMLITSTTLVTNLNADLLDGQEGSYYNDLANAVIGSQAQGDILYFDGSNWARLPAGTSGQVLQTQGASADPVWANASAGTVTSVDVSGGTTGLTTSGGPITGSGTVTLGGTLAVGSGGTGATTAGGARTNLGLGTIATQDAGSVTITGGSISGITDLAIADGGTGAGDAATARSNLSAAESGANSDITSLSGLTTALSETQGGTGLGTYTVGDILYSDASNSLAALAIGSSGEVLTVDGSGVPSWSAAASGTVTSVDVDGGTTGLTTSGGPVTGSGTITLGGTLGVASGGTGAATAAAARGNLGAAASGANSDITSLSGLTTALSIAQGGTGATTAGGARTNLGLGTIATQDASSVSITGGTVDGTAVGGSTPAAGAFTTLSSSGQYTNTVIDGTAPMIITSTTAVTNLNADLLDGEEGSYYNDLANAIIGSQAQGDVLYFNGTSWTRLPAGTSGEFLQTQGAGSNPTWATAGGAPTDATYITQTSNASLTNEQALDALSTGLMQVTTGTGVVSSVTDSAGVAALISDETGTGALVFGTSPTLGTPDINTPDIDGGTIDGTTIGATTPSTAVFGDGTNNATFDADGDLTFAGTADYLVANNAYAFKSLSNENYGLVFNVTNVRYEFRDSSASRVFSIGANTGNVFTSNDLRMGDADDSNYVGLQSPATVSSDVVWTLPAADGTADQVLSTDGAGTMSWETVAAAPNIFYAYDNAGGQTVNGTEVTLNLDTEVFSDSYYTLAADQVTISQTGVYRISVNVMTDDINTGGGARSTTEIRVQESGVDIPGAVMYCYHRETTESSCSMTFMETFDDTDVVRVRIQRRNGTTNYQTISGSKLTIELIRSS